MQIWETLTLNCKDKDSWVQDKDSWRQEWQLWFLKYNSYLLFIRHMANPWVVDFSLIHRLNIHWRRNYITVFNFSPVYPTFQNEMSGRVINPIENVHEWKFGRFKVGGIYQTLYIARKIEYRY